MASPQVRVFINYRHDDTQGEAQLLYDRLASRFGSGNLFLDVRSLQPGMEWLKEIKSHSGLLPRIPLADRPPLDIDHEGA